MSSVPVPLQEKANIVDNSSGYQCEYLLDLSRRACVNCVRAILPQRLDGG
jgi:hypothetical protein